LATLTLASPALAQELAQPQQPANGEDLYSLSLEDLMQVEVTSASRKSEPLDRVPAAIFVLTHDDLRRSGATSIPEALRLVPGLDVARLDSNRWAVSARGFNNQYSNKLLVLIDGRSVYTPSFSGVYWDAVDVPFEDIERIEIIRGPGAALWGANAVNGVISIITRDSAKTQGALVSAAAGDLDRSMTYARYGGLFDDGSWRVWGKYFDRDATEFTNGSDAQDDWHRASGGFRTDLTLSSKDKLLVEADLYRGEVHNQVSVPSPNPPFQLTSREHTPIEGWSLLSRWTRITGESSELQLQTYVDATSRDQSIFDEQRTDQSIDLQHRFRPFENQEVVWGMSYRSTRADSEGSALITMGDSHRTDNLFGAFLQDEISVVPDRWKLTLGTKLENNDYTGWELQPNARLSWTPDETQIVWGAVSRAVRTPSQAEDDISLVQAIIPGAPNQFVTITGNPDVEAERLTAYEIGYRVRPMPELAFDLATFYNDYDDLINFEQGTPFMSGGNLIIPVIAKNATKGHSYGAELAADWAMRSDTRMRLGYSYIDVDVDATAATPAPQPDDDPHHQVQLRTTHDLTEHLDLDLTLMYVDSVEKGTIGDYFRTDVRTEWRPTSHMALIVGVQNIFHDGDVEFGAQQFGPSSESRTTFYFKVTWSS
ncbi:MAG: TonB-dependent receptor, partial [Planctomycetota bacterium]